MTRVTRRQIVRALHAPAPGPPEDLGRKIKEQIPEDLFAPRAVAQSRVHRLRGRNAWAVAASVLVALGSGYLAVRLFEEKRGAPSEVADLQVVAPAAESSPLLARRPTLDTGSRPDASSRREPSAAPQSIAPPPAKRAPAAAKAAPLEPRLEPIPAPAAGAEPAGAEPAPPLAAALDDLEEAAALSEDPVQSFEVQKSIRSAFEDEKREIDAQAPAAVAELERAAAARQGGGAAGSPTVSWRAERRNEVQADARALRRESRAAAGEASSAGRAAETDRDGFLSVQTHPVSTLAVTAGAEPVVAVDRARRDAAVPVPVEAILDAAVDRPAASPRAAIEIEGTATRSPGRAVLLLSAVVAEADERGSDAGPPSSIEVELDAGAVRRYRLLASHARSLAAAPLSTAAPSSTAPLYRVSALYEIELARHPRAGAALGTARLRGVGSAAKAPAQPTRTIDGADLAGGWDEARLELRLAVLAAELALPPPEASPLWYASLERELERLLTDASPEGAVARRAAELKTIASRSAGSPGSTALRPAAPARNDG